jgi:ketosteroid isomerase-like protein
MTGSLTDADRSALTDLVHRYAAGVDDRDLSAVAALFCPDGVLVVPDDPVGSASATVHVGRESVELALGQVRALRATIHAVVGIVLDAGTGQDEASGRVACIAHHVVARHDGARDQTWHLVYRDQYRRTSAGWRIASRELRVQFVERRPVTLAR